MYSARKWIASNCVLAAKRLPRKILVRDMPGYVVVDQGRSGKNPDGTWSISGTDSEGNQVFNLQARDEDVSQYSGQDSPYWQDRLAEEERQKRQSEEARKETERISAEDQFMAQHGLSRRKLSRDWMVSESLPDLNLDGLRDPRIIEQTLRVLKQMTGQDFSQAELEQMAKLQVYKGDMIRVKAMDTAAGTLTIFSPLLGEDDQEVVSAKVLRAFATPMMPEMPQEATGQEKQRKTKALRPYQEQPEFKETGQLSREMMARMTPALAKYLPSVSLRGDIYENFGVQRYKEPMGERFFADEMKAFGMDTGELPEDVLHYNPTRSGAEDEALRGAWSGYVTLMPDSSGRVPPDVLNDAMKMASDSRPHLKAGDKFVPYDSDEFLSVYKRGPVYFSSNNLFRHLVGLGYFETSGQQKASSPR